ncbi:basic proline-rich protein-like [Ornithorhynchus anatinus]|uniref:basic proline-rich protein-like n=1 Tax=Ornithorhynchus anatinus TaxID=9258 RepID=UPI0019D4AC13|nr:basic proline-rich protein-like [Ornithorhynchus anatinus]
MSPWQQATRTPEAFPGRPVPVPSIRALIALSPDLQGLSPQGVVRERPPETPPPQKSDQAWALLAAFDSPVLGRKTLHADSQRVSQVTPKVKEQKYFPDSPSPSVFFPWAGPEAGIRKERSLQAEPWLGPAVLPPQETERGIQDPDSQAAGQLAGPGAWGAVELSGFPAAAALGCVSRPRSGLGPFTGEESGPAGQLRPQGRREAQDLEPSWRLRGREGTETALSPVRVCGESRAQPGCGWAASQAGSRLPSLWLWPAAWLPPLPPAARPLLPEACPLPSPPGTPPSGPAEPGTGYATREPGQERPLCPSPAPLPQPGAQRPHSKPQQAWSPLPGACWRGEGVVSGRATCEFRWPGVDQVHWDSGQSSPSSHPPLLIAPGPLSTPLRPTVPWQWSGRGEREKLKVRRGLPPW